MKKIIAALIAAVTLSVSAQAYPDARVAGKLDLASDFDAIVMRDLADGLWLGGAQKTLWKLERISDGAEIIHVAFFWASRAEGQSTAYGPAIGLPVGPSVAAITSMVGDHVALVQEMQTQTPPWVSKIGEWTSLDFYGYYRPDIGEDLLGHHFGYGIGGKVKVPLSSLFSWISKSQGGGL